MKNSATLIALAWPDTKVIHEGKWYDEPMRWVGAINNGYYKAGHAALLLINNTTGTVDYYDFGRYQTPMKYGRVRCKLTDPDIEIKLTAVINNDTILNLEEILLERFYNKSCHGDGRLTASIVKNIDYQKAHSKIVQMKKREAIYYGPFEFNGATCSRLVAKVVFVSTKNWLTKLMILFPYTISATPRSNNKVLNDCSHYYEVIEGKVFLRKSNFFKLKKLFMFKSRQITKVKVDKLALDFI